MFNHETHPISIEEEIRKQQLEELREAKIRLEELENRPTELGELQPDENRDLLFLPGEIERLEEVLGLKKAA